MTRRLPKWAKRLAWNTIYSGTTMWALLTRHRRPAKPHSLPGELVVSLTSYPARFRTLHLTLKCLFDQTVRPDRIVLWVARKDIASLPERVRRFPDLEVRTCDDIGPFKKLVPAIEAFPNAYLVTADDDLFYSANWLETLVAANDGENLICMRSHPIDESGAVDWFAHSPQGSPTTDIFPTSGSGILFPPGSLHPSVSDRAVFLSLCPTGDDGWYFHMALKQGRKVRNVGGQRRLLAWPGTQGSGLWNMNEAKGNDAMVEALNCQLRP